MSDLVDDGKRDFLKHAALLGAASGAVGTAMAPNVAFAQMLETGMREDSILAKCRKEGVMRVGYRRPGRGSTRMPRPANSAASTRTRSRRLAKEMEVKVEWKEVTFAERHRRPAQGRLRPVRLVADLYGAARARGRFRGAAIVEGQPRDGPQGQCRQVQEAADFNDPNVTFSVMAGGSEEPRIPILFPRSRSSSPRRPGGARRRAGARQEGRRVDQRRQRRDALRQAQRSWAHVFDPGNVLDRQAPEHAGGPLRRPRVEDFLDLWAAFMVVNGEIERLFKLHMEKLGGA